MIVTSSAFAFFLPLVVHSDKQLNINTGFDSTPLQLLFRLFLCFNRHVFLSLCAALVMAGLCSNSKLRIALQCSSGLHYLSNSFTASVIIVRIVLLMEQTFPITKLLTND